MQVDTIENTVQQPIQQEQVQNQETVLENNTSPQPTQPETEDANEVNWKRFREQRKKERAEKEAAERRAAEKEAEVTALKAAMEAAFSRQQPAQPFQQNEYAYPEEETQDQIIQKKIDAALSAREEQYRREQQEREQREYPERLKRTYADFNQVISEENLDWLDCHYPEISRPLQRLPNDYDKWSDIYLAIKKFVPNHSNARKDTQRAETNLNKPRSMSSLGSSQQSNDRPAAILTEEKRAANWERMQKTINRVS